jgi:hypothetical protein
VLTSGGTRRRKTLTCELLERIRGEINKELQISWRTCRGLELAEAKVE